ncbi:hypothetical protein HYV22_00770 [Candidatus Gottesmanbacteria bacterium]|nr:hypothetical protein [Candidatus Gottesmanbacteria bacterium]
MERTQSGQILLISLLVLSVATTIALSLIGRTATDVNISNEVEESARALAAAEAGVEQALQSGLGSGGAQVLSPNVTYDTTLTNIGLAAGPYLFPQKTARDNTEVLWLTSHDSSGNIVETPTYVATTIELCWSTEATTPAVEVTIPYKKASDGSYRVARGAFDPVSSRTTTNKFTLVAGAGANCGQSEFYKATLDFTTLGITPAQDTLLALHIKPIYSAAQLGVNPGSNVLPIQGNRIDSTGSLATGITRRVVVLQSYRTTQGIFDAVVFSQSSFGH